MTLGKHCTAIICLFVKKLEIFRPKGETAQLNMYFKIFVDEPTRCQ